MYSYVLLLVTIIGSLASYMSYIEYRRQIRGENGLICRYDEESSSRCLVLYMLPQARLLGKIHFSVLAPVYFSVLLALVIVFVLLGVQNTLPIILALYTIGLIVVPYLVYLEYIARAICIWCTIMHISIAINVFTSAILYFK